MRDLMRTAAFAAAGLALTVTSASAYPLHHHHHRHYAPYARYVPPHPRFRGYSPPYAYGYAPYAYGPYGYAPGEIIQRATIRAQHEPGVTNELAPDSRQTATGGPSGGVPGFSGD